MANNPQFSLFFCFMLKPGLLKTALCGMPHPLLCKLSAGYRLEDESRIPFFTSP